MKYIATGRVQPERADIFFSRVEMGLGDRGGVVVSCDSSQITVLIDSPEIDGWMSAEVQAEELASVVVSALGFSLGSGYSVNLIQITEDDGTPHVLGVRPTNPEDQGEDLSFIEQTEVFNRALRLAARDVFFRMAVRDYLQAMNDVSDCAMYCYRAIESIKCSFVMASGRDRWDEMHAALGTNRATLTELIKNYADPARHGNWTNAKPTDKFIRYRMLGLTRDILKKYVDHEQPNI
nr:hypothetical protein [uncultured Marinobacter sp.]